MRTRSIVVTLAAAAGLFVTAAVAQHEEHQNGQAAPPAADKAKMGGMMAGNMMSQMPQMMAAHKETGKLVDRLMTGFAAIEAEKDPAALQAKLAEHGALLKELQAKVAMCAHMMDHMMEMQKTVTP